MRLRRSARLRRERVVRGSDPGRCPSARPPIQARRDVSFAVPRLFRFIERSQATRSARISTVSLSLRPDPGYGRTVLAFMQLVPPALGRERPIVLIGQDRPSQHLRLFPAPKSITSSGRPPRHGAGIRRWDKTRASPRRNESDRGRPACDWLGNPPPAAPQATADIGSRVRWVTPARSQSAPTGGVRRVLEDHCHPEGSPIEKDPENTGVDPTLPRSVSSRNLTQNLASFKSRSSCEGAFACYPQIDRSMAKRKDPHAVALGRKGGKKGGKARWEGIPHAPGSVQNFGGAGRAGVAYHATVCRDLQAYNPEIFRSS